MHRKLALTMVAVVASSSMVALSAPAQAESTTVTINAIGNRVAHNDDGDEASKVTISPSVDTTGHVKVTDATLALLAPSETSPTDTLTLGVGGYTIRTEVTYKKFTVENGKRIYGPVRIKHLDQTFHVFRPCATKADFNKVAIDDTYAHVKKTLHQPGEGVAGGPTSVSYGYLVCDVDKPNTGVWSIQIKYSVKNQAAYKVKSKSYSPPKAS